MGKSILHGDPYENLANAIVLSAVDDYRRALRRLSKNPDSKMTLADVESLERFFKSSWYAAFTSVDGKFLIRKLRAETTCDNQSKSESIRGNKNTEVAYDS